MKDKKILLIIIILVIGIVLLNVIGNISNSREYELKLPDLANIQNIILQKEQKSKTISDVFQMQDIVDTLNNEGRQTKEESIQDNPINVDNKIKIDFYFKKVGISTLYVYEKSGKYYIEQPYNGIYKISKDDYNLILKYIK